MSEPSCRFILRTQLGQAMTEFVVSVAFVFMVIFVVVPTFGKIIDLQFQNLMASRYVAWERTVWFDQTSDDNRDDFVVSTSEFESVAVRADYEIMNTVENRFFREHGMLLPTYIDDDDISEPSGAGSPVWTYVQSKNSMYGGTTLVRDTYDAQPTPAIAYDIFDFVGSALNAVKAPIDFLLGTIGNENEDLFGLPLMTDERTYFNPRLRTYVRIAGAHGEGESYWDRVEGNGKFTPGIESAFFQRWNGLLETPAGILADGWSAQSVGHYKDRADDYVPSTIFKNDLFDVIIDAASYLEGGPSNSAIGKLEFGDVGIEPMPAVEGKPVDVTCDGGYCSYEE